MSKHLCTGTLTQYVPRFKFKKHLQIQWWEAQDGIRPSGIKRIRLVCPVCKRRILASVSTCEDGCCVYFKIPPHKKKMWWKKNKARWRK